LRASSPNPHPHWWSADRHGGRHSRVDPEEFRVALDDGVDKLRAGGGRCGVHGNMQYSPRTEAMLAVAAYADAMRFVALKREAVLFDRFTIMRRLERNGAFDLYGATRTTNVAEGSMTAWGGYWPMSLSPARNWRPSSAEARTKAVSRPLRFLARFALAGLAATCFGCRCRPGG